MKYKKYEGSVLMVNSQTDNVKVGKLAIALYPTYLNVQDGNVTYHAKVVNRDKMSMDDICRDLVASGNNCGLTADEIKKVWLEINEARIKRLAEGISSEDDLGTVYPAVKGTFSDDQAPFKKDVHSVTVQLRPSGKVAEAMAALTPVITQGNTCHPVIDSVQDMRTQTGTTLTPGGLVCIRGRNICLVGDDDSVGLYFENALDAEEAVKVPAVDMSTNSKNALSLIIPKGLNADGRYRIRLVTQYSGNKKLFRKEPQTTYAAAEFGVSAAE